MSEEEASVLDCSVGVRMGAIYPQIARIVTHNDLTPEMIELAIAKLQYIIKKFGNK